MRSSEVSAKSVGLASGETVARDTEKEQKGMISSDPQKSFMAPSYVSCAKQT